jgi:hypothetical protein
MSESEYRENTFFSIFGSVPEPAFESLEEQIDGWGACGAARATWGA